MEFKRFLSAILVLIMILSLAVFSAFATNTSDTQKTDNSSDATDSSITADSVGVKNYVKELEKTYYKGNLGATYEKSKTTFKVWSPFASSVKVCIYSTGTDSEEGAQMLSKTNMKLVKKYGTWVLELNGDYKNKYYTYEVTVNGETNEVVDPYAKAVGANGDRGMVVDLPSTNPDGWENDKFNRVDNATQAVIWEVSVRDFSASPSSGVSEENRGKFLAFTEEGTVVDSVEGSLSTCVDYLKELGVNYVQINPFYDFASIDETDTVNPQYNWGYDPKNYNVPEGSYSSDPYDGNVRIKECKQMIQSLHNAGIGVIMDVVYNHTYLGEDSWFNLIVPDYYYRIDSNLNWSNGSGCGNDTASERIMYREFMKNSVMYWAQEYHIDGFRFDLMGLHDVDTMNYIREHLDTLENGKKIIMYGEAWDLSTASDPSVKLANQNNLALLSDRIGAFNDTYRDGLKGNNFIPTEKGFVQSGSSRIQVKDGISGMTTSSTWGTVPAQCINYASCHDNLTLYDKLFASMYGEEGNFRTRHDDLVSMNKLAAAVTLTSQGVPFMLAGEEMGRSKDGDSNSYKSPVELNQIDWNNINLYASLTEYYKGLIDIRNTVDLLTDPTATTANSINYLENLESGLLAYTIKGTNNTKAFAAVFNGSDSKKTVTLPSNLCKVWVVIANNERAGITNLQEITDHTVTVQPHSCVLLVNKSSFAAYSNIDTSCRVVVKYINSDTNDIVYEQIIKGEEGQQYNVSYPNSLLYNYNITSTTGNKSGKFKAETQQVTVKMKPYTGDFSSVTIHFVDEYDEHIADSVVMTNRVGQKYTTPQIAGVYGYKLDLEKLPKNGAGEYTQEPIVVTYRYNSIEISSEDSSLDPESQVTQKGTANVIYMGNNGEILKTKSYKGDLGAEIVVEQLEIDGYKYVSRTSSGAKFSDVETNIILNYQKKSYLLLILLISAGVVALAGVTTLVIIRRKKNPHIRRVSKVGDDLMIEE